MVTGWTQEIFESLEITWKMLCVCAHGHFPAFLCHIFHRCQSGSKLRQLKK